MLFWEYAILTHPNGQFLIWSGGCPLFVGRMPLNVIFSNLVTSVLKSLQWSLNTVNYISFNFSQERRDLRQRTHLKDKICCRWQLTHTETGCSVTLSGIFMRMYSLLLSGVLTRPPGSTKTVGLELQITESSQKFCMESWSLLRLLLSQVRESCFWIRFLDIRLIWSLESILCPYFNFFDPNKLTTQS